MGATGYQANTVTVGSITDNLVQKPAGSGVQQITPTIPAAIAQTAADTLPSPAAPFYTKSRSTVLVLTLPSTPGFTTNSLMGVFWTGADGSSNFCLDCVITTIAGDVVTITAPTLSANQLAAGMLYFNGATTTGAGDVSGKKITAGTTEVTFSVATLATTDLPSNPDLTDYNLPIGSIEQLIFKCATTGAVEFLETATVELACLYSYQGDFYSYITGEVAPWAGTVNKLRFYNSTTSAQTMSVGALMA